ncbi:hypothetical protein BH23ACT5_BH23ACT5_06590 [soil metagenome]
MSTETVVTHTRPPTARSVWALAGLGLAVLSVTIWTLARSGEFGTTALSWIGGFLISFGMAAYLVSGAVIVSRQPRNMIGWLLMVPGFIVPVSELGLIWLTGLDPVPLVAHPGLWLLIWFTSWAWVLLVFPVFHLLLTFPTGRLLSDRWKWAVALEVVMVAAMVGLATFPERLQVMVDDDVIWSIANPIGLVPLKFFDEPVWALWSYALLAMTVISVSAVVLRFRRGSPLERQQLKWPLSAICMFGVVYGLGALGSGWESGGVADLFFGLALAGIPVSVAIAVTRYRLYELDRILSRTVSYAVVVGLLAALFFGTVGFLSSLLAAGSDLATAGSTLAIAALFNPLRDRVQSWVERKFNRARYDIDRVLERSATSLRDGVDPDDVARGWLNVVSQTMQPTTIGLWVREP